MQTGALMPIYSNSCIAEHRVAFPKMCGIDLLLFLRLISHGWPVTIQSSAPVLTNHANLPCRSLIFWQVSAAARKSTSPARRHKILMINGFFHANGLPSLAVVKPLPSA